MNISQTNTVAELAVENPATTRVFEKYGIDYCCGGNRTLVEACQLADVDYDQLVKSINEAAGKDANEKGDSDWRRESLKAMMAHIIDTHHVFTRTELARLNELLAKVCDRHGAKHPELAELQGRFHDLRQDLIPHMLKEEQVLFPYIDQLEQALTGNAELPVPFFGTVRNPVNMMEREHEAVGALLREIRALTSDFTPPQDACISYRTLYGALSDFEADLHQHIHLENNILFPRAVAFEKSFASASSEDRPDSQSCGGHSSGGHPSGGCFGA